MACWKIQSFMQEESTRGYTITREREGDRPFWKWKHNQSIHQQPQLIGPRILGSNLATQQTNQGQWMYSKHN